MCIELYAYTYAYNLTSSFVKFFEIFGIFGNLWMLGKVCVKVGHDAEHDAEHGAEPKTGKFFHFFKFVKYSIFPFLTYFP